MVMLKISDMNDFESLPMTKWNIRQPDNDGSREDATESGEYVRASAQYRYTCFRAQYSAPQSYNVPSFVHLLHLI